jgi:hypothetical protein
MNKSSQYVLILEGTDNGDHRWRRCSDSRHPTVLDQLDASGCEYRPDPQGRTPGQLPRHAAIVS